MAMDSTSGPCAEFVIVVTQGGGLRANAGGEGCPSVHLAFDHRDHVDVAFHGGGAAGQGQPGGNGLLVAHNGLQIITICAAFTEVAGGRAGAQTETFCTDGSSPSRGVAATLTCANAQYP